MKDEMVLAIPKGRILPQASALLQRAGIQIDQEQLAARKLTVATSWPELRVSVLRNSDILLAVRSGTADLAIVGKDQLAEDGGDDFYDLLDLGIARCWLKVAAPAGYQRCTRLVRVATKFSNLTRSYYATQGIQAQIVKLNGAMELAVQIGLADEIVDLVESGRTLAENNLEAIATLLEVSSHLIANRDRLITKHAAVHRLLGAMEAMLREQGASTSYKQVGQ